MKQLFPYLALLILIVGCTNNPGFDEIPEVSFVSFSKSVMEQGDLNSDSLFMTIAFKDGDGNLGGGNSNVRENIIITDTRTGDVYDLFKIPDIPNPGIENGLEGEITLKLFTTCCIFPDSIPPCFAPPQFPENDISFSIVLKDDDGNESETVTTPNITLRCN